LLTVAIPDEVASGLLKGSIAGHLRSSLLGAGAVHRSAGCSSAAVGLPLRRLLPLRLALQGCGAWHRPAFCSLHTAGATAATRVRLLQLPAPQAAASRKFMDGNLCRREARRSPHLLPVALLAIRSVALAVARGLLLLLLLLLTVCLRAHHQRVANRGRATQKSFLARGRPSRTCCCPAGCWLE
jgi:hypothetical protein